MEGLVTFSSASGRSVATSGREVFVSRTPGSDLGCVFLESLPWRFNQYSGETFIGSTTGSVELQSDDGTTRVWVTDPEASFPVNVTVLLTSPGNYRVKVTASSSYDGEYAYIVGCPNGIVTMYATGAVGESTSSNFEVSFSGDLFS